jgi:hypothetical protein
MSWERDRFVAPKQHEGGPGRNAARLALHIPLPSATALWQIDAQSIRLSDGENE